MALSVIHYTYSQSILQWLQINGLFVYGRMPIRNSMKRQLPIVSLRPEATTRLIPTQAQHLALKLQLKGGQSKIALAVSPSFHFVFVMIEFSVAPPNVQHNS